MTGNSWVSAIKVMGETVRIFPLTFPRSYSKVDQRQASHGMQLAADPPNNTTMEAAKTPAERAREKSLLNDPLAILLGPSCVECKQCKRKIKLSTKSAYDTFHWRNHRARCLKTMKKMKKKKGIPPRQSASTPPKAATKAPRQNGEPPKSQTPPLIDISDSEEDHLSTMSPEIQSPIPPSSPPSVQTSMDSPYSMVLSDYIIRSHPECTQRKRLSDHWKSWSWSQLKEPRFERASPNDEDEDDEDEQDNDFSYHCPRSPRPLRNEVDSRDHEAAHALSMLSRSH